MNIPLQTHQSGKRQRLLSFATSFLVGLILTSTALELTTNSAYATFVDSTTTIHTMIADNVFVGFNNVNPFTVTVNSPANITYPYGLYTYNQSTTNINSGAIDFTSAYNNSRVNIYGGSFASVGAYGSSSVNVYGGSLFYSFGESLIASGTGTASMFGGTVRGAHAYQNGVINIASGTMGIENDDIGVTAEDNSTVNVSGGTILYDVDMNGHSALNLSGGTLKSDINANDSSTVQISNGNVLGAVNATNSSLATVTISGGTLQSDINASAGTVQISGGSTLGTVNVSNGGTVMMSAGTVGNMYNSGLNFFGATISGGEITGTLSTAGGATNFSGGVADGGVITNGASYLDFNGSAEAAHLNSYDNGFVWLHDNATIDDYLAAHNSSDILMSGGSVETIKLFDQSRIDIYGGHIGMNTLVGLSNSAITNIVGTDLTFDPVAIAGTEDGESGYFWGLHGFLANGDVLDTRYFDGGGNSIAPQGLFFNNLSVAVPEGPTGLLFVLAAPLAAAAYLRRRTRIR